MFDNEAEFAEDTERLFRESPANRLETKIFKVKNVLVLLHDTIE